MNTTLSMKKEQYDTQGDTQREWFHIDATEKTLGRIATQIAGIIRGKHKPTYTPHVDTGDFVVVTNAEKIRLTGQKLNQKIYYHHTGYPGGIKSISAQKLLEKDPTQLLIKAVQGMLPKNKLNRNGISKLKVYQGDSHPHQAQNPKILQD